MTVTLPLLALLAGVSVAFLSWSLLPATVTRGDRLALRKRRLYDDSGPAAVTAPLSGSPTFEALTARLHALLPAQKLQQLEARLGMAGHHGSRAPVAFVAAKVILAVGGLLIGTGLSSVMAVALAASGFIGPDLWLRRAVSGRQQRIVLAMPDSMDMLAVTVEAGLTLDGAFQRLAAHEGPSSRDFCQEIRHFLKDIQLGRSRREAFRELGSRSGVHDLQLLTSALNQADQWGVEMANVMRVQADHLRTRRLQRAEEQAMKAPIKILFPLVFCIFPAIFVVLLGPAALQLMKLFPGT